MADQTLIAQVNGIVAAGAVAERITLDFSGTIDQVVLSANVAPTVDLLVDVLINGVTAITTTPIGVLAGVDSTGQNVATAGITATDARIGITVNGTATQSGIQKNAVVLIDTEEITVPNAQVGSNSQQGAGSTDRTPGGVDSVSTSFTVVAVGALRAQNGTVAAAHLHAAPVYSARPRLSIGTNSSGTKPGIATPLKFNQGDVVTFFTSGGTSTADLSITLLVSRF